MSKLKLVISNYTKKPHNLFSKSGYQNPDLNYIILLDCKFRYSEICLFQFLKYKHAYEYILTPQCSFVSHYLFFYQKH